MFEVALLVARVVTSSISIGTSAVVALGIGCYNGYAPFVAGGLVALRLSRALFHML